MTRTIGRLTHEQMEADVAEKWRRWHQEHAAPQEPPRGAINTIQYGKINGVSQGTAHLRLLRAAERGEMESGIFRVLDRMGKIREQRFWWQKRRK